MRMLNVQVSTTPSGTTAELMLKVKVVSTLHVWQSVLVVHDRGPPSVQLPLTQRLAAQSVLVVQLCAPPPQFRAEEALWLVGEPEIAGLIVHAPEVATLKVVLSNLMKLEVPTTLLPFLVKVMSMLTFCPAKPLPLPTLTSGGVGTVAHVVDACRKAAAHSATPPTAHTAHPAATPLQNLDPMLVTTLLRLGSEAACHRYAQGQARRSLLSQGPVSIERCELRTIGAPRPSRSAASRAAALIRCGRECGAGPGSAQPTQRLAAAALSRRASAGRCLAALTFVEFSPPRLRQKL